MRRAVLPGLKLFAELVAAGVAILAVLLVAGAILLARGPISLDGLVPEMRKALARLWPEAEIDFGHASLSWARSDGALRLELLEVEARTQTEFVRFPRVEIDLSAAGLGQGFLVPATVRIVGAQARLRRAADGKVSFGISGAQGKPPGAATSAPDPLLRRLLSERGRGAPLAYFRRLEIVEASLAFRDDVTGLDLRAPQARIEVQRDPLETRLALAVDLALEDRLWPIAMTGTYDPETDRGRLTLSFRTVKLRELARLAPQLARLEHWPGETRGEAVLDFADLDTLAGVRVSLLAGGIRKRFGSPFDRPLVLDTAALSARYEPDASRLVIEALSYQSDDNDGRWWGEVTLARGEERLERASWSLEARDTRIWVPVLSDRRARLDRLSMRGNLDLDAKRFAIDELRAGFADARVSLAGSYGWSSAPEAGLALEGDIENFPSDELLAFWPHGRGMGARDWLESNLRAGVFTRAHLKMAATNAMLAASALPNEAMRVDFSFEGATVAYVPGLTPLTEARGTGVVQGNRFDLVLDSGKVGDITVTGGTMTTENFEVRGSPGVFHVEARGPARALVGLLDMGPFGYPSRYGFDVESVTGLGEVAIDASLPLRRQVRVDQIDFGARAKVRGYAIDDVLPGLAFTDVDLDILVDNDHAEAKGTGHLNGVAVGLGWQERFAGGPQSSHYRLDAVLDAPARIALGLDTGELLEGPVSIAVDAGGKGMAIKSAELKADLSAASVKLEPGIWEKPAGTAAGGRLKLSFETPGEMRFEDIFFASADAALKGTATLARDGRLVAASFPEIRIAGFADLSADARRSEGGGLEVNLDGRAFDAGPFLEGWTRNLGSDRKKADKPAGSPVHVAGRLETLSLRDEVPVSGVSFDFLHDGRELAAFTLTGRMGKAEVAAAIAPTPDGRTFRLYAENGGEILEGLTGTSGLEGGVLEAEARIRSAASAADGVPSADGTIRMKDFRVRNLPLLARVLMLGSFEGIGDLVQGEGIRFRELEVPVHITPERVTIANAHASGQTLGLTLHGTIDRTSDEASLRGTIVPAYAVNSIVGAVPVLGDILVGRENEGLIGVTYAILGPIGDPRIVVNPLSALAPGFLRRLFEGSADGSEEPQPPAAAGITPPSEPGPAVP